MNSCMLRAGTSLPTAMTRLPVPTWVMNARSRRASYGIFFVISGALRMAVACVISKV
ncbi:hypothetical protein D9M72_541240 [compost metagenome]